MLEVLQKELTEQKAVIEKLKQMYLRDMVEVRRIPDEFAKAMKNSIKGYIVGKG